MFYSAFSEVILNIPKKIKEPFAGWPQFGSVRLRFGCGTAQTYGSGFRFRRFLRGRLFFPVFQHRFSERDGSDSWKTVLVVPVPISVPGNTPDLLFLVFFWKMARKTTKKARIFYPCRTLKILGKERKNAQKCKEFLEKEKSKEIQKSKEKKIRDGSDGSGFRFRFGSWAILLLGLKIARKDS